MYKKVLNFTHSADLFWKNIGPLAVNYNPSASSTKLGNVDILLTDIYLRMIDITKSLDEYVYGLLADKSERGADSMLQEKVMLWGDRIRAEAKAEEKNEFAEKLIIDGVPVGAIERYTGLNVDALQQIADSIGVPLRI